MTLSECLTEASTDELVGRVKLLWVLESLAGAKKVTTRRALEGMSLDGSRAISDLEAPVVWQILEMFDNEDSSNDSDDGKG